MPIKAFIGGVDVSTYLKNPLTASPGGDGVVGDGTLVLDQQAGGLDLRPMMDVKVWITFNAAGSGVAAKGRLFGGHVAVRDEGAIGNTKTWVLRCYDYNVILHKVVRDAAPAKAITLTAGTFAAQIQQLTTIIQQNGAGVVNTQIDATTGVASLYATMPAVTYEGGHPYGWYIQQLCNTAQSLNTALIPHFYMGVASTFGIGDTFGNPVLYVYNGASLPAIGISFSDVIAGGRKGVEPVFRRTTDGTAMIQRRQAFFGDAHVIVTSANATSQSTYPNPYINNGGTGNTGYWSTEVIEDRASSTFAEAQAALDRRNLVESSPVETIEFTTIERVLPGDMVGFGWTLAGIADDTPYRVAKVGMTIEPPETIVSKVTLNSRRLGLFDDGQAVFAPPIEGDNVAPLPPASFTLTANYYDGDTGDANMIFAIGASPSPDVVGYSIRGRVGHTHVDADVETELNPALIFPSGLPYSLQAHAYDRNRNYSEPAPSVALTGTTAVPVYEQLVNPDFDAFDRIDSTLPYHWTRSVVAGGTATYNTASHTGPACVKLSTTASVGSSATILSGLVVVRGATYGLVFWANINSAGTGVTWQYDWYDNTQAFISSSSGTKTLTTSYARYTATATAPATAAYYKLSFKNNTLSRDVRVDTVTSAPQAPTDSIEDGAVGNAQLGIITDPSKIGLWTDPATPRYIRDLTGIIRGREYAQTSVIHWDAVNTGGGAPVSVSISSTTGDILSLSSVGGGSGINSTSAANLSAAAGFTATLSGDAGATGFQAGTGGLNSTAGALAVGGALSATAAFSLSGVSTKTATFTADASQFIYLCNSASAITANLPTAVGITGRIYVFKQINTGKVTIDPNGSETIDGITTFPLLEKNQCVTIQSDGGGWRIIGQSGLILESDGTRWLGDEIAIPLVNYQGTQPYSADTEAYACAAFSDWPVLITRMELAYHVFTTNGASNYWTATFRRLTSGVSYSDVASVATNGGTNDTWTKPAADTTFSNNPTATNDIFWQVNVTKTGSPGNAFLIPTVKGRQVYS